MQVNEGLSRVVAGRRYDVAKSTLLASDRYWDGHTWQRHGRNRFLYRTPKGAYFLMTVTCGQGERDQLVPVSESEAWAWYKGSLSEHAVPYEDAFRRF